MAVAQRMYARALFQAAQEQGRLEQVAGELRALAAALDDVPELERFLRNPQVDPHEKSAVLEEIAAGADELVRNFVRLVAQKGRAGELRDVESELQALVARAQNRLAVELVTAHELSDEEARSIVEAIEEASGRTVEATRAVDPGLIGGIVLQVGSFRADGSVRGRLERLGRELATTMKSG
jgi:F-type H+-transporting ATPase subunit delta